MSPLHKYLHKEHLEDFRKNGSVFINTLYDLRVIEHAPIRDGLEGKRKILVKPTDKPITLSSDEAEKLFPNLHYTKKLEKGMIIPPTSSVTGSMDVQNVFCFSASINHSEELCKKFCYNSCYRIINQQEFAKVIFEEINKQVSLSGFVVKNVKYADKEIVITKDYEKVRIGKVVNGFDEVCFSKPKDFRAEREVRMIFIPLFEREIEPILIHSLDLIRFCDFP